MAKFRSSPGYGLQCPPGRFFARRSGAQLLAVREITPLPKPMIPSP